jgi:hypothetical protein
MKDIAILTPYQQEKFNKFIDAIKLGEIRLFETYRRDVGKSFLLKILTTYLTETGYKPYIYVGLSPMPHWKNYTKKIVNHNEIRGISPEKIVVIIDDMEYTRLDELLHVCAYNKIPVIGFITPNYKDVEYSR